MAETDFTSPPASLVISHPPDLPPYLEEWPPTEDELPSDDGKPMETPRHRQQMNLLIESLELHWVDRDDFYVGGNMFLYYNVEQQKKNDFTGPDFFVVLDVPKREHKSWVIWQEGKGPDVVIELLSDSTADYDLHEKKRIYQDRVRVPEYFCYDPFSFELTGFRMSGGRYQPIPPDPHSHLLSERLGLRLVLAEGEFQGVRTTWLRLATPEGEILPSGEEKASAAQQRTAELEATLAQYRAQFGKLSAQPSAGKEQQKKSGGGKRKGRK